MDGSSICKQNRGFHWSWQHGERDGREPGHQGEKEHSVLPVLSLNPFKVKMYCRVTRCWHMMWQQRQCQGLLEKELRVRLGQLRSSNSPILPIRLEFSLLILVKFSFFVARWLLAQRGWLQCCQTMQSWKTCTRWIPPLVCTLAYYWQSFQEVLDNVISGSLLIDCSTVSDGKYIWRTFLSNDVRLIQHWVNKYQKRHRLRVVRS